MKMLQSKKFIALFWLASAITVAVLTWQGPAWWDTDVYATAMHALKRGGDPYAEGIAAQQTFQAQIQDAHAKPPMTYVYSPLTLPMLRVLGHVPDRVLGMAYYTALLGGFLLQLWAAWKMALPHERSVLPFLFPAVAFFPGLLNDDVVLSGNVVYLLYGLILAAAVPGWKRDRWGLYYAAVLAASCFKAPLLSLLALPVFFGHKQWWKAAACGVAGVALFASQAFIWPKLFAEYLTAVNLQFTYNDDFGFGPAGLLGSALWHAGLPYSLPSQILYLAFAALIGTTLWLTVRRLPNAPEAKAAWLPVVLVGTILLNPRVKEYDIAPLTIPLVLIAWRACLVARAAFETRQRATRLFLAWSSAQVDMLGAKNSRLEWSTVVAEAAAFGWFLAINFAAGSGIWKPLALVVLLAGFTAGTWATIYWGALEEQSTGNNRSTSTNPLTVKVVQ